MKDNISSKNILNRKIILELRFSPIPKFLDLKGKLLGEIDSLKLIPNANWGLGDSAIKVSNSKVSTEERVIINLEINRLSFVSTQIDSIDGFLSKFKKIYDVATNCLGDLDVTRIGCRILGTYKTKSVEYDSILKNFKTSFPTDLYVKDFPIKAR